MVKEKEEGKEKENEEEENCRILEDVVASINYVVCVWRKWEDSCASMEYVWRY